MRIKESPLKQVFEIEVDRFEDYRGIYVETFNEALFREHFPQVRFVQDDYSMSRKDVLRGMHGDSKTWKMAHCPMGTIYLVVMNYNKTSPDYGKWTSFIISEANSKFILIPPGFANGHLILSERAMFVYKQSEYYDRESQFTVKWNDPQFGVKWPVHHPILSQRDG